jgi:predicted nucleic acid-binding protein
MAIKVRRVWDSVCCFGFLMDQEGRAERCARVLTDWDEGNCEIVLSALTLGEVLHIKGEKRPFTKDMRDKIRLFFRDPRFLIVDVDRFIAEHAQDIFWEHNIMPKDAIHVATAMTSGAHYLETFDGPLLGKSRQLGGDPQLVIQLPGADLEKAEVRKAEKKPQLDLPGPLSS